MSLGSKEFINCRSRMDPVVMILFNCLVVTYDYENISGRGGWQ